MPNDQNGNNIFGQQPAAPLENISAPASGGGVQNQSSFEDLLGMITNEQGEKKYKDVTSALHGLQHSQSFISTLKNENAQLKQELERMNNEVVKIRELEETIRTLTSGQQAPAKQQQPVVDQQSVAELINQTLSQRELDAIRQANIRKVVSSVQSKFGDKAEQTFYDKAKEVGMSAEAINSLAAQSPEAVFRLLGLEGVEQNKQTFTAPSTQSINTLGYQPQSDTFIKANAGVLLGATTEQLINESANARKLVDELHAKGLTTYDLTDPKVYKKYFS